VSLHGRPATEEVVAQLMLLGVLFGAVHWGRNGGFVAAVLAIGAYIALRAPLIVTEGFSTDLLALVGLHMVTYGFVGIVGGEVCGRIKYTLVRLEHGVNIDADTRVYNERFVGRLLESNLALHARYRLPFSIGLMTLSPALTSDLRPTRRKSLLRAVATHIREDVRLVDDVGRIDDGRFILVFPQTPKAGGTVAAERVSETVRNLLGARDESVSTKVLGAPEDLTELQSLRDAILQAHGDETD
jgi:GGDEF domain-containing protein